MRASTFVAALLVGSTVCCLSLSGQDFTRAELAALLAGGHAAEVASFVTQSPREREGLLLDLTTASFPAVDGHLLQVGLADVFGQVRAEESVPFLLDHLTLRRNYGADFAPWTKIDPVVLGTFPCIQALIAIGATASRALINRPAAAPGSEERLAAVFVVAHIEGVPEAVAFLGGVSKPTPLEQYHIKQGLALQGH